MSFMSLWGWTFWKLALLGARKIALRIGDRFIGEILLNRPDWHVLVMCCMC